jgi:uncharacterized cupin superfamily protein
VVNLADLPLHTGGRANAKAQFGEIGRALGFYRLGAMLHIVQPGEAAFGFHRHHGCDELFFILSGTGEYRAGEERIAIKPGDCLGAPAGGFAHQIINTGSEDLRYLGISNIGDADLVEHPETGEASVAIGVRGNIYTDASFSGAGTLKPYPRRSKSP